MGSDHEDAFATRSIHVGEGSASDGDVVSPIHLSSTFRLSEVPQDKLLSEFDAEAGEYLYTRMGNPTRQALQERLAAMTGGSAAFAFASGTAAVASTVFACVRPGESIVACEDLYGGTVTMLTELCERRLGIDVTFVSPTDVDVFARAIDRDTSLVLIESPTNPLMQIADIEAIAAVADEQGVPLAVDNTFATPYLQRPLELGADIVIHSTTKYLNGHSDGLGGAVATNREDLASELAFLQRTALGNPMAPADAYLVLRGTKTLPARMDRHEAGAAAIAQYLTEHDAVRSVAYPGLADHPQHELATRQMDGFGGILSFELAGTAEEARTFLEALETFSLAVSLGGVESLIELPAAMTHGSIDPNEREARGISETLIRASVGIEAVDDLIADLDRGFMAAFGDNA